MNDFVVAESGIRQLTARMTDAVWRKDAGAFAGCFAPGGEWKIAGQHFRGREEIKGAFAMLLGVCERVQFIASVPMLEVEENSAIGRMPVTELAKKSDGSAGMNLGIYYERYVCEDGRWYYQWRHFGLQYTGPVDLSAEFMQAPDYGEFPNMPEQDEPTLTRWKSAD